MLSIIRVKLIFLRAGNNGIHLAKKLSLLLFFAISGATSITKCVAQDGVTCDHSLWNHVYHASRFTINRTCSYAIGYVQEIYAEPDGDYHMRLKLEPDFKYMLNPINTSSQGGDLVCEIICANQITQADAVGPCQNYTQSIYVPNVGEHIKVTGPFVTDNDHGWNEIHPINSIVITTQIDTIADTTHTTGIPTVNADNISVSVFPNPASSFINFELSDYPSSPVVISITDADGRSGGLYQMMANPKFAISTTYFPNGIYYYSIIMSDKLIRAGNFIVMH